MADKTLLLTGIIGTAVSVVCCFTPLLVVTLGALGFSFAFGWLDVVLLPALVFFPALTVYAILRRRRP